MARNVFFFNYVRKDSINMADTKFLPVDALARQQLNRRALTAHRNFISDNLVFDISSSEPKSNYDEPDLLPSLRVNFQRAVGAECSTEDPV